MSTMTKFQRKWLAGFRRNTRGIKALSVGFYPQDPCPGCKGSGTVRCATGFGNDMEREEQCDDCHGTGKHNDCPHCPDDYNPDVGDEGSFSRAQCDTCGETLAGDRHAAHGLVSAKPRGRRTILAHFEVCTDCLLFLANGDIPEGE